MEYNWGMMSASTWRGGSQPSPRLLQGLRGTATSHGLGQGPIKFYYGAFWGLELCSRNSVKWQ